MVRFYSYGRRLPGLQFRALAYAEPLSLTFRHRAGVTPYTSSYDATWQRDVFLLNSRGAHFTAAISGFDTQNGTPSSEVTGLDCRVP